MVRFTYFDCEKKTKEKEHFGFRIDFFFVVPVLFDGRRCCCCVVFFGGFFLCQIDRKQCLVKVFTLEKKRHQSLEQKSCGRH